MRISYISVIRKKLEDTILKFVPSLNYLKLIADAKLDLENSQNKWKPVLLFFEEKYNAAFIVEEMDELITLYVSKNTSLKEGEIITTDKKNVTLIPASYDDLHKCSKAFGKGYIPMIKSK